MHVWLAILAAIAVAIFRVADPWDQYAAPWDLDASSLGQVFTSALGTLAITLPFAVIASSSAVKSRWRDWLSIGVCIVVPCAVILDALVYRWIGHHLGSRPMLRAVTDLRDGLIGHASANTTIGFAVSLSVCIAYTALILTLAKIIPRHRLLRRRTAWLVVLAIWSIIVVIQAKSSASLVPVVLHPPERTADFKSAVMRREIRQRVLTVIESADTSARTGADRPDILIVVAESFRHELISPDGTPNLWRLAHQGTWCRQHYSGGNATNHGVFSIVSSLEAIWYPRPIRFSPTLNRLFRFAGYEVGFFGGHDDWQTFHMDGFIGPEHFDEFQVEPHDGLASDRRAAERANQFLRPDPDRQKPRLAMLYLYATHATYDSYPDDQKFTPAADDRFMIPYSGSARDQVWNRYRNAAVTVDRFIGAITQSEDLVVVFTGDHGESFLEDGTIGHGTQLSPEQNMTPAIIRVPGSSHRTIEQPTMHADLLPTLLSAAGIRISDTSALDGLDLTSASDARLAARIFVTRNYFDDQVALVHSDAPMQTGATISLKDFSAIGRGPIWDRWFSIRFGNEDADPGQSR